MEISGEEVSQSRWEFAQENEISCWDGAKQEELVEHSKYYSVKANKIKKLMLITKRTKILQIGCGPYDIINQFEKGERHAIDPLADFYKEKFNLDYSGVKLVKGVGEKLPYKDNYFDLVIIANVLDHVQNPKQVLGEIRRVLKESGIVYLEAHFYQKRFLALSKLYDLYKRTFTGEIFNPCHPHMFDIDTLKNIISNHFYILFEKTGEDIEREIYSLKDLKEFRLKEKMTHWLPAYFGMLGLINYSCICSKDLK